MYKVITFDMFSAVLDIEGTAEQILRKILPELPGEQALSFFRQWRKKQWDYVLMTGSLEKHFVPYAELTEKALIWAGKTCGVQLNPARKDALMRIWYNFDPWPEAREVIAALKERGFRVAMLSNGDTQMLTSLAEHIGISFDDVFSAQRAGAYKPRREIYAQVRDSLHIAPEEHLHVAGSMFDTMGAAAHGVDCCWSNRHHEALLDEKYRPRYEVEDLRGLLNILK